MIQACGFEFYVTVANVSVGVSGISLTSFCRCSITKAMLAGISHTVSSSFVLAQLEKKRCCKGTKTTAL